MKGSGPRQQLCTTRLPHAAPPFDVAVSGFCRSRLPRRFHRLMCDLLTRCTAVHCSARTGSKAWRMYVEATKLCAGKYGCGRTLPVSQFYRNWRVSDGRGAYCKECDNKRRTSWARANPYLESVHARSVRYGISCDQAAAFMDVPVCQSCGDKFNSSHSQKFDHCHELGHVRGVICNACNMACAGTSKIAIDRLQRCIEYLRRDIEREQTRAS